MKTVVLLLGAGLLAAAPPVSAAEWVASWAASPSDPLPGTAPPTPAFADQTVRTTVRLSLGGPALRLQLSNALGAAGLAVGEVHVARLQDGAVLAGSDRAVTFSGRPNAVLPRGAPVLSDPVVLDVPDGSDIAVSLFFPTATGPVSEHALAVQTSLVAAGNVAGAAVLAGASPLEVRPVLAGVAVRRPDAATVVTLGDSITDGQHSTVDANNRYPDALARRLLAAHLPVAVANAGINGNRLLSESHFGPNALSRFDRDVASQPGVRSVIVLLGINDIGHVPDTPTTAAEVIAALRQLAERGRERGLRMIGATLLPFEGSGYATPAAEAMRAEVNGFIRGPGAFDAVVDFDAATRDPAHPTRLLPALDSGDHLHPNDQGYATMADAVDLRLLTP